MQYRIVLAVTCLAVSACDDTAGPGDDDREIAIRADRAVYEPGQLILITTTNRSAKIIYDNHCGGEVEGYEFLQEWNASYGMGRGCFDHDPASWRARSIAIPAGATHVDTMHVNSRAYTGRWRVRLVLHDETGALLPESQSISNIFRVNGTWTP